MWLTQVRRSFRHHLLDTCNEFVRVERFSDEAPDTACERLPFDLRTRKSRDEYDSDLLYLKRPRQIDPAGTRHLNITDDEIEFSMLLGEETVCGTEKGRRHPHAIHQTAECRCDILVVIDYRNQPGPLDGWKRFNQKTVSLCTRPSGGGSTLRIQGDPGPGPGQRKGVYNADRRRLTHTVVLVVETFDRRLGLTVDHPVFAWFGAAMTRPLRVAVIDDDEELRLALEDLLASLSHVVGCFADGASYLKAHEDFGPDVIISDFHMPGMTGIEVVRELRSRGAGTPAILITAYATEATRRASVEAGFSAMLKKPFDTDEFVRVIEATTGR